MDGFKGDSRIFENVFFKMLDLFSSELASGGWSIFKTEKHIIMEISALPIASAQHQSPHLRASSPDSRTFQVESVESITLDSFETSESITDADANSEMDEGGPEIEESLETVVGDSFEIPEPLDHNFSIVPENSFKDLDYADTVDALRDCLRRSSPDNPNGAVVVRSSDSIDEPFPDSSPRFSSTVVKPSVPATKQPSQCRKCGKTFANARHMTRHVKAIHLGLKHKCPFCGGLYARADGLKNHINSIHAADLNGGGGGGDDGSSESGVSASCRPTQLVANVSAVSSSLNGATPFYVENDDDVAPESRDDAWEPTPKNRNHRQPRKEPVCAKKVVVDGEDRLECPYCFDDSFDGADHLQFHLKESHKGKIHLCAQCYTLFLSPWKLKRHLEGHRKKNGLPPPLSAPVGKTLR